MFPHLLMEQERLDRKVEPEAAMATKRSAEEENTNLLHSTHTNVQVRATMPCGASLLILTYVSTRPPCTHGFVKQPFFSHVPLILSHNR